MQKKTTLTLLGFFTSAFLMLFAQTITVTGVVTDANNVPMPGVNILVKGTTKGATTNFDGDYTIIASSGDVLIFSYVGFKKVERTVSEAVINVTLQEDASSLDEVVVTAFGIKRETRELGYSVTQVKTEDLDLTGQTDALSGLQGRVAGVQISQTSGSSGGGIDILIRGITSVNPNRSNQPLIIIDGLALDNDTFSGSVLPSAGSNSPSSSEQFSFTNRGSDINPEDIESYNVLKGAAATALYGVRAANGAIIITTKKGKLGKAKVGITASTTMRNINTTPELQKIYREGFSGLPRTLYTPETDTGFTRLGGTSFYSWGPEYSADSAVVNGETIDLTGDRFYNPYDLFQTGVNTQVDFNISGADDKLDYYFSVGNDSEKGVLPNTDYDKTTLRFKAGYKVTEKFNINTSINYTNAGGKRGNGGDKSVFSSLAYYSATFPINDYINEDGTQRNYSFGVIDNPRYLLETSPLTDDVNRWVGNATFNWAPKDWINVTYAAQVDNYSDQRNRFVAPDLDAGAAVGGFIVNQNINFLGLESNLLVTLNKKWSDDFGTTLTLGNQISDSKRDYSMIRGETLNVPGINDIANTINIFADKSVTQIRNVGVFGELKADYKNQLFLTVTGRNDWTSTLEKNNRSFFYPSVSLAYDFHELIDKGNEFFNFGKLRASWAEVGKGPGFGETGSYFVSDGNFPFSGSGGYRASTIVGEEFIVPEKNRSFEIGTDLRFFKNRVRVDYAYYKTRVKNQIFTVGTAYSSGISGIVRNAGDFETFGHELLISYDVFKTEDFHWETMINWSTNEGKVLSLPEDIDALIFADAGAAAGITSEIRNGDKMGELYGYKWRYENGQRYIGPDGLPRVDRSERVKVGNAFPDFVASFNNVLRYKNFSFNFLLEWKEGGDLYDAGRRNSIRNGNPKVTEFRDETVVLSGVMDDGSGGFVTNTIPGVIDQNYYRDTNRYNSAAEILIQDASWVKLRNIGLSYNFGKNILSTLNIDNLSVSISAHNILIWTPYDGYDPEGNQYSAGSNVYGFTGLGTPLSESYSFGIKLGF
ncbi:SusC/RagA family TonB-linked outer membrane protein [Gelidibacter japonicus]|uniref:SusC/RagA family TonB-linked outer membrane protein n=1 Tax=Gelidibacter japonicus TaxID=1962232 RepID=UPI00202254C9|nr:SusC/RagA family TonB-linked outer membrane protein [Gelidibacter japonicus]MCL8008018.1 SusC/RagA family TonB-linked outer membrane protein [Gelidibacter japonicus]